MGIKLNLKNVRVDYVNVFEKGKDRTDKKTGDTIKGKYGATIYLDKDDPQINQLDAVAREVLTEAMGSSASADKWIERNFGFGNHADKCCVRDLEERDEPVEGFEKGIYINSGSHKRPRIQTSIGENQIERGLTVDGDEVEGQEVYSGCYANVSLEFYWYKDYKVYMCNLLGIRFRKDGEAFGGAGETATDDDLGDDDDAPAGFTRYKRRTPRDASEEEEAPRRSRRSRVEEDGEGEEEEERPRRRSR